jgi:TRAP-type transport system small permease protein
MKLLVLAGGAALLVAMVTDVVAVLGRATGWPLLGSIELVQAAVLVSGSAALLITTLTAGHARVHLLMDRLPSGARRFLVHLSGLAGLLLFLAVAASSAWILADLWHGHEETELLKLPLAPLRVLVVLCSLATASAFLRQLLRRGEA